MKLLEGIGTFLIGLVFVGAIVGALVGAGFLMKIVFFPVHTADKMVQVAYDAQDKVLTADNAIYNYEWFKQKNEDISASKVQLDNVASQIATMKSGLPTDQTKWDYTDKEAYYQLLSTQTGLQNYLQSQIADYNARAKMATRNIFQDGVLPTFIDALTFIRK